MKIILLSSLLLLPGAAFAQPAKELQKPAISQVITAQIGSNEGETGPTLSGLLSEGYEIINVDAPVGEANARFILRKGNVIYSCLQRVYREGTGSGRNRGIPSICENLTPAT